MEEQRIVLCATGDNSMGQLLIHGSQMSLVPTECNHPSLSEGMISTISSYKCSNAVVIGDKIVFFKPGDEPLTISNDCLGIRCLDQTCLVLRKDHQLFNAKNGEILKDHLVSSFSATSIITAAVDKDGLAFMAPSDLKKKPIEIGNGAISVCCTEDAVYVAKEDGLYVYNGQKLELLFNMDNIKSLVSSEYEMAIIDQQGFVYTLRNDNPLRVYGLPPVIKVAVGTQHFAAITTDHQLFVWGFNPSGQFGIGTTVFSDDPLKVMDDVLDVSCGENHMLVLCNK